MKRRIGLGLLGVLAVALAGAGALLAQRAETRGRTFTMTNSSGGNAWLGVELADVTAEKAGRLKLPGEYGAVVEEVEEDSPAARAGIKKDDVILGFEGENVWSVAQFRRRIEETPAGRAVTLQVSREGQMRTLTAKLEAWSGGVRIRRFEMPEVHIPEIHMPNYNFDFLLGGPRLGISGDDLTSQLAESLGVKQGKGVLVMEVSPGSPAQKAGMKAGDCITRAGTAEVGSVSDLRRALERQPQDKKEVTLTIVRDRHEQTLTVELERQREIEAHRVAELGGEGINPEDLVRKAREELRARSLVLETARKAIANRL